MTTHTAHADDRNPRPKLTEADVAPLVQDAAKLELAQLILDGYDEDALYRLYGPGWRLAIAGTYHTDDCEVPRA